MIPGMRKERRIYCSFIQFRAAKLNRDTLSWVAPNEMERFFFAFPEGKLFYIYINEYGQKIFYSYTFRWNKERYIFIYIYIYICVPVHLHIYSWIWAEIYYSYTFHWMKDDCWGNISWGRLILHENRQQSKKSLKMVVYKKQIFLLLCPEFISKLYPIRPWRFLMADNISNSIIDTNVKFLSEKSWYKSSNCSIQICD